MIQFCQVENNSNNKHDHKEPRKFIGSLKMLNRVNFELLLFGYTKTTIIFALKILFTGTSLVLHLQLGVIFKKISLRKLFKVVHIRKGP